jgi:predicted ATP-dependent endonuclease of OLD family
VPSNIDARHALPVNNRKESIMQASTAVSADAANPAPLSGAITPLATPAMPPPVRLSCAEIVNFRRLTHARLDFDDCTTVLVGANNSGKTSLLIALRNFLSESPGFRAFDISLTQWTTLRQLGEAWDALDEDPTTDTKDADIWEQQYQQLMACMPFADLWFDAQEGAYHYVAPFLTTLMWSGGIVGLRLRLEPVSDANDLRKLAWRYHEARAPVRKLTKKGHAWPTDLLDYWLRHPADLHRIQAYRLDPSKGPLLPSKATTPQHLPPSSQPVELALLRPLIRVDFVPAQRGLGVEDDEARTEPAGARPGLFSNQLVKFARQHLSVNTSAYGQSEALVQAIANAQASLDDSIFEALQPAMQDVQVLGYPGLHDPQEMRFRTRIRTADLLAHGTAIQYRNDKTALDESLPEHSIGLGYQNLQSLSFTLVSFRTARLNPAQGTPAAIHLVMVEEPEAHLHVQVQRCFSTNAHALLCPKGEEQSHLRTQLLISTHSSHLAHGNSFTRLRYVKRTPASAAGAKSGTRVINLADVFGGDVQTRTFAERYFQVQHTDLLFADAAIFVEGVAERMLVPMFIARDFPSLSNKYLSFLDIGGSHAHRLRPLVECLGIPTVIITDLDPVVPQVVGKRTVKVAVNIAGQQNLECGNATLTAWHPKLANFQGYGAPITADLEWTSLSGGRVRFAWQVPIPGAGGQWPSSFEDALVLSNIDWFKRLDEEKDPVSGKKVEHRGTLGRVVGLVVDYPSSAALAQQLHVAMHKGFNKGDFAATLFERYDNGNLVCPGYISEALNWLAKELHVMGVTA